jgi:hypothetical protein
MPCARRAPDSFKICNTARVFVTLNVRQSTARADRVAVGWTNPPDTRRLGTKRAEKPMSSPARFLMRPMVQWRGVRRRAGSLSPSSAAPQPGSEGNKALLFQRVDEDKHERQRDRDRTDGPPLTRRRAGESSADFASVAPNTPLHTRNLALSHRIGLLPDPLGARNTKRRTTMRGKQLPNLPITLVAIFGLTASAMAADPSKEGTFKGLIPFSEPTGIERHRRERRASNRWFCWPYDIPLLGTQKV